MADKKISELTSSGAIGGTEELPIVQSGSTVKTTINAIKTFLQNAFIPYTGATQDTDLGNYSLNAKSLHVKGTGGNGHLGLKHQSANITAGGGESSLGANSSGEPFWKNDGNPIEQLAYKSYVDTEISSAVAGLLDDRGNYDASSNLFPSSGGSGTAGAILKGDLWTISVIGTLGGVAVTVGDVVRALSDSPGQTSSNWVITENNIGYVPENNANKSTSIVTDQTSNTKYPSVKSVYDWAISTFKATFIEKTAFNKDFGITAGTILEGNRITQTITSGVTDKAPSEDAVKQYVDSNISSASKLFNYYNFS